MTAKLSWTPNTRAQPHPALRSSSQAVRIRVTEGVSIFVSSGDEDAGECDDGVLTHGIGVNALASSPYVVAVGGTDFSDTYSGTNSTYWNASNTASFGSAKSYVPEIPWNDSCASVLIAMTVTGKPADLRFERLLQQRRGGTGFPQQRRRKRRPERLCDGHPFDRGRRQRQLCRIRQAHLAKRVGQSQ
jgi:hypothetical protein